MVILPTGIETESDNGAITVTIAKKSFMAKISTEFVWRPGFMYRPLSKIRLNALADFVLSDAGNSSEVERDWVLPDHLLTKALRSPRR